MDIKTILNSYPRTRPTLPDIYQKYHHQEILAGRKGSSIGHRLVLWAESWMHHQIAKNSSPAGILELGAGTLNHIPYEKNYLSYDVIEPFDYDHENTDGQLLKKIRFFYHDLSQIPSQHKYDRIISIAVLEHLEYLPKIIAQCALKLNKDGKFQAGIPCEGEYLWRICSTLSTGILFRLRTGLSYKPLIKYEHINTAEEIIAITRFLYNDVKIKRFPALPKGAGVYSFIEATNPNLERCKALSSS
jgi:hypothetical protein